MAPPPSSGVVPQPRPAAMRPQHSYPDVITRRQLPHFNCRRLSSSSLTDEDEAGVAGVAVLAPKLAPEALASADALLANGPHNMHETLAAIVEGALGTPIPTVDVRFRDLTVKATFTLYPPVLGSTIQVPTLLSPLKKAVQWLLSRQQVVQKDILQGVTGVFRPGRMTLVLGDPGSGKSSLMKILSGRFPVSRTVQVSGEIAYNGRSRAALGKRLPRYVAYADAQDIHYGRMTVEETLQFARACSAGKDVPRWVVNALAANTNPASQHDALEAVRAHHRHAPDLAAKILGLDARKTALVGESGMPGLSPTDRKRLTLGEMAFGMKAVAIVDDISAGMEPTAKLALVESLKSLAVLLKKTVVVSLNQPTPEEFALFDDVLVLNDGHAIYHGPRADVLPYFHRLGFDCPQRKEVPEFLLELGTPRQRAFKSTRTDLVPMTPAELATCFQQSELHQAIVQYLNTPHEHLEGTYVPSSDEMTQFRLTFGQDLALLLRRHWLLVIRNKAFIVGRAFMVLVMGALYGTTFWQILDTTPQLVVGLLFSCSMFLSLGQAAQIGEFMNNRAVFYKQRGANFFRTSSYVIASCLSQVPYALVEAILYGSLLYWMGGYVSVAERFVKFLFTLFLCQNCFTAFFFLLSSAAPNASGAQGLAAVFIMVFTLLSGFLITKSNIPTYFHWLYWINPIAWCIRALAVNQYTSPQYRVCEYKGVDYCKLYKRTMSVNSLVSFDLDDNEAWVYRSWLFFFGAYVVFSFFAYLLLEYKRFETPEDTMAVGFDLKTVKKQAKRERLEEDGRGTSLYQMEGHAEAMDGYILHATTPSGDGNKSTERGSSFHEVPIVGSRDEKELTLAIPRDGCSGFVPVTLAFQDLWYSVPAPGSDASEETDLLRDVSGFALPGTMTALIGARGAGKTTLLDVISGRKTAGKIRGDVFLNGYPATDLALRRCAGYCDQLDIHSDSATFREAMQFAATLRQDASISKIEKIVHVEECIDLLELRPIADRIIRGATKEQLKRLTIGVEMAASPSLLFVDEPVHGLDGRAAMVIMTGLRKVADTGRTVICTIDRPSSDVFALFDSALALHRGGQMVFFGQLGDDAAMFIDYFANVPGVPPLKRGYNPATWVLDALDSQQNRPRLQRRHTLEDAPVVATVDFAAHFETSDLCRVLEEDLDQDGLTRPSAYLPEIKFETKRAAGSGTQFATLLKRSLRLHWRTPTYNLARMLMSVILAAFFGVMYHNTHYDQFRGANAGIGMIFLSSLFIGLVAFNGAVPVAAGERASFYRERESQTYNALWYFVTSTLSEIPFVLLTGVIFTGILFPLVGFKGSDNFVFYWFVISLHLLMQVYMAQFMVYTLPSAKVAAALGSLLSSIFLLFTGYNPPTYKIPSVYKWIHYIAPPTYTISSLSARMFAMCSTPGGPEPGCKVLQGSPGRFAGATLKQYMESAFQFEESTMWRDVALLYLFTVLFRALALVALRYVKHHKG